MEHIVIKITLYGILSVVGFFGGMLYGYIKDYLFCRKYKHLLEGEKK